jgi:TM2 domain-containing membrane protein YozV
MTKSSEKTIIKTFAFGLFLGGFGAHRFYVGKIGSAIAQLGLSLTIIGLPFSLLWVWIDLLMIITGNFKDGEGRKIDQVK